MKNGFTGNGREELLLRPNGVTRVDRHAELLYAEHARGRLERLRAAGSSSRARTGRA